MRERKDDRVGTNANGENHGNRDARHRAPDGALRGGHEFGPQYMLSLEPSAAVLMSGRGALRHDLTHVDDNHDQGDQDDQQHNRAGRVIPEPNLPHSPP
jgi:hypothetical protein